jgi:hypothetical protein
VIYHLPTGIARLIAMHQQQLPLTLYTHSAPLSGIMLSSTVFVCVCGYCEAWFHLHGWVSSYNNPYRSLVNPYIIYKVPLNDKSWQVVSINAK